MNHLAGMQYRFVEDIHMVNLVEDWSAVRSPSRATRRRKLGYPQRIKIRQVPNPEVFMVGLTFGTTIVGHPETLRKLKLKLKEASQ